MNCLEVYFKTHKHLLQTVQHYIADTVRQNQQAKHTAEPWSQCRWDRFVVWSDRHTPQSDTWHLAAAEFDKETASLQTDPKTHQCSVNPLHWCQLKTQRHAHWPELICMIAFMYFCTNGPRKCKGGTLTEMKPSDGLVTVTYYQFCLIELFLWQLYTATDNGVTQSV